MKGEKLDLKAVWLLSAGSCPSDYSVYAAFSTKEAAEEQLAILKLDGRHEDYYIESKALDFPIASMLGQVNCVYAYAYLDRDKPSRASTNCETYMLYLEGTEKDIEIRHRTDSVEVVYRLIDGDFNEMKKAALEIAEAEVDKLRAEQTSAARCNKEKAE